MNLNEWFENFIRQNGLSVSDNLEFKILPPQPVKDTDKLTIAEFAEVLNLPTSAVISAVEAKRGTYKPYYTITELADRWNVSRATVYNVLREFEAKLFNAASKDNESRVCRRIPAAIVERIEKARSVSLPEPKETVCK
jgi:hypothetical protein